MRDEPSGGIAKVEKAKPGVRLRHRVSVYHNDSAIAQGLTTPLSPLNTPTPPN